MDEENELCDSFYFLSNGKRKFMRIFITFEGERVPMDIPMGINVGKTKALIVKKMSIPQSNVQQGAENQLKKVLVLNFAGAELPDYWILSDLGISPGTTLKAYMKEEMDPILYFRIGYNQDTIPILEKMKLPELSVADLRSLASKKSGLPCSVFRLVTENGKDMFDCYMVEDYGIRLNSIVKIETWDGWNDFLHLCSLGFTHHVLEKINSDDDILARYQMKVAMFMAAHFGHVDLAVTMCRQGVKPGEPVGLHPLRQWCPNNQHIENLKAPIHEAVEFGQLSVLRAFVHHNITSILCKDGAGLQPLNIALRKKMKSCASFLLTKQWSRIPFNGNTITLSIFSKLKKWTERAKEKASMNYNPDKPGVRRKIIRSFPLIGQGIYIDGYSADQISSRSKFPNKKTNKQTNYDSYYQNLYGFNPEQYFKSLNISTIKAPKNRNSNRSAYRRHNKLSTGAPDMSTSDIDSQIGTPDVFSKEKQFKLPKINAESSKSTEMKSRASSSQSNDMLPQESQANIDQKVKKKKKNRNLSEHNAKLNKTKVESNFPLPLKSIDYTPRPYYYVGPSQIDDIAKSVEIYYKDRGYLPREYAIKCLSLTNQLKDKSWLSQVRIAMKLGKESVKKSLDSYADSILSQ